MLSEYDLAGMKKQPNNDIAEHVKSDDSEVFSDAETPGTDLNRKNSMRKVTFNESSKRLSKTQGMDDGKIPQPGMNK